MAQLESLHINLVTRLAWLLGQILWSVHIRNFSLVNQEKNSRKKNHVKIM